MNPLMNKNLPKWPQMIVTGVPVTREQAEEIIFRTDDFFTNLSKYSGGNCHEFNNFYREIAGIQPIAVKETFDWGFQYQLRSKLRFIDTGYVFNDWGSSSFIHGPHGWCSPEGVIFFKDNVGKWPTVISIFEDWSLIAEAFPFLDLNVTLMDGESSESDTFPVVNIRVVNGTATLEEPNLECHSEFKHLIEKERDYDFSKWNEYKFLFHNGKEVYYNSEIGMPIETYRNYAARVKEAIECLTAA